MAHATHFLQRLQRLQSHDVETALRLYRKPPIVEAVLAQAKLAEGVERVALALWREPDGPHVIVTRDGAFVTCLGAGMVTDCPQVPRSVLDRVMQRAENMELAERLGGIDALLRRLNGADALSREDYVALTAVAPALVPLLMFQVVDVASAAMYRERVSGRRRAEPADQEALWRTLTRAGHAAALLGSVPNDYQKFFDDHQQLVDYSGHALQIAALDGLLETCTRMLHLSGRLAKWRLPSAKHEPASNNRDIAMMQSLELATIALSSSKLRGEAVKVLERTNGQRRPEKWTKQFEAGAKVAATTVELPPEAVRSAIGALGRKLAVTMSKQLPSGTPHTFEREDDVPLDLAVASVFAWPRTIFDSPGRETLVFSVHLAAQPTIAETYLPQAVLEAWQLREYHPINPTMYVEDYVATHDKLRPIVVEQKPGRNELCSCGSGKKYKRCCA